MQSELSTIGLEPDLVYKIGDHFADQSLSVKVLRSKKKLLEKIGPGSPSMVIIGNKGKRIDHDLSLIREIRVINEALPVVMVVHSSSEDRAIAAFRAGASDYFPAQTPLPCLLETIKKFIGNDGHRLPAGTQNSAKAKKPHPVMIGQSTAIQATVKYLKKVASTDSTVLITGETGTGKELASELIHYHSPRAHKPLVSVNCAALPESLAESELFGYGRGAFTGAVAEQKGKFAQANGGTILLDEIGDMVPSIQAKILHTIEQKVVHPLGRSKSIPLDVRIIAATNHEPEMLITSGRFREDLYYRLNIVRIHLPPLRERAGDIPALVDFGIKKLNKRFKMNVKGLTQESMQFMECYAWPGNVRELMNVLEATFIHLPDGNVTHAALPPHFRTIIDATQNHPDQERRAIISALLNTNWNRSQAARQLNWSRMTLYRKMAMYRIIENRSIPH